MYNRTKVTTILVVENCKLPKHQEQNKASTLTTVCATECSMASAIRHEKKQKQKAFSVFVGDMITC
jgi:uracil phosphoribosyltransferase